MEDVLLHIYNALPLQDMYSCSLVSRHYNKVFNNLLLWKMKLDSMLDKKITNILWSNNSFNTFKKYILITKLKNELKYNGTINELYEIKNLNLSYKKLTTLQAEIGQLTNLQQLSLNHNQLNTLPAEIGQLTNLQELFLSHNQLNILPAEIGQLTNLQQLYLYNDTLKMQIINYLPNTEII